MRSSCEGMAHTLANELTEESDQFRFLRPVCLANLQGVSRVDLGERIGQICQLGLLYLYRVSFVRDVPYHV
jgi:hypothetical protein